jgi:hypothetical protein
VYLVFKKNWGYWGSKYIFWEFLGEEVFKN